MITDKVNPKELGGKMIGTRRKLAPVPLRLP
jgi:hypothetical protein